MRFSYGWSPIDSFPYLSYVYVDIVYNRLVIASEVYEMVN